MDQELHILLLADLKGLNAGLKNADKDISNFSKNTAKQSKKSAQSIEQSFSHAFNKLGPLIAGAFSVSVIKNFTTESVRLAATMEGVEEAFKRIDNGDTLKQLRTATRGTVDDLKLMQLAVQANNFEIPLNQLASLFDFARKRAKATGESVDFLVNSIVTGIGRKSPLILDNLGISASRLQKELKGVGIQSASVGDISKIVGKIATEEMAKMGQESVTTADKIQQVEASFKNLKIAVGGTLTGNTSFLEDLSKTMEVISKNLQMGVSPFAFNNSERDEFDKTFTRIIDRARANIKKLSKEDLGEYLRELGWDIADANTALDKYSKSAKQNGIELAMLKARVEAGKQAYKEVKIAIENANKVTKTSTTLTDQEADAILKRADALIEDNKQARASLEISREMARISKEIDFFPEEKKNPLKKTAEALAEIYKGTNDLSLGRPGADAVVSEMEEQTDQRIERVNARIAQMNELGSAMAGVFTNAFSRMAQDGEEFHLILRDMIKDLIFAVGRMLLFQGLMTALTGGISLPAGALVPNLSMRGFSGLTPFANGGIVSGPTAALIGEYAGARSNPEVVAPLDKLSAMMQGGQSVQKIIVEGRISGQDIILAQERADYNRNRKRGF